jgi:5-methylcytosine-specific restriction protein A
LPKHGFIINLRRSGHCILRHDIPFTVGAEYFRDALLDFSGSQQNREGIIYGDAAPGFLICTSGGHHQERYGYEDRPIPGGLGWHYFGQGANGNQRLDFRGNAMLTTAQRVVMFFTAREQTPEEQEASSSKRKLYRFEGFFTVGAWEWFVPRTGIRRGDRLIRYRLVPLSSAFDDTGD